MLASAAMKELIPWDPSNARTLGGSLPWMLGVQDEPKLIAPYSQDVWVYICVRAIARRVGSLPFALWQPQGEDVRRMTPGARVKGYLKTKNMNRPFRRAACRKDFAQITTGDLPALLQRPNPTMAPQFFWEMLITYLQLKGNAFIYKERLGVENGPVKELWLYPPWRMRYVTDDNGMLMGWVYRVGPREIPIALDDLIHFREPNPYYDHWGLGAADVARLQIEQQFAANLFNKALFQNYGQLGGVLKYPKNLTDPQFKRLLENWRDAHAGVTRAYDIAILDGGGEYQDTAQNMKDLAFIEGKKMTREEICAAFGVPPAEVGIFEYANYANALVQQKQFWFNTVLPIVHGLESTLQVNLVEAFSEDLLFEADLTGVQALKEELTARVTQAKDMATSGWPINQINHILDLGFDDVPWGDDWWIPFSQVPARALLSGPAIEPALPPDQQQSAAKTMKDLLDDPLRERLWKGYVATFQPIEQRYRKALREYFYAQRAEVLRRLYAHPEALPRGFAADEGLGFHVSKAIEEILFELDTETGILREVSRPYFERAQRAGGEAIWAELSASGAFGAEAHAAQIRIANQLRNVRSIVAHARKRVARSIEEGLNNPDGAESVDQIAGRIRDVYRQLSGPQAQTIARTETAKAFNEGRDEAMDQLGVEQTEWLSARDESVRTDPYNHAIDGQRRGRDEPFSNGLFYPHDPGGAAGNVINCRCVALPVMST